MYLWNGEYLLAGVNARQATDSLQTIKYYADSWNRGTMYLQSVEVTAQKERTESATFYVSNSGDDSADGQTPETAWQTVERVNKEHFIPGDQIFLNAAENGKIRRCSRRETVQKRLGL